MASVYNITIEKGASWSTIVYYKDSNGNAISLSGCSVSAMIKATADLSAAIVLTINAVITNASAGEITLSLTKAQTSSLTAVGPNYKYLTRYAYDVLLNLTDGSTIRLLHGDANISPGVTA